MIAHHRSTLISALLGAGVVLLYLWARMALADAGPPLALDAGPPVALVDAGTVDRIVAADHAPPVIAAPPTVEPASVDEGLSLASWLWQRFRTGQATAAVIVLLQVLGLAAIKRWAWVGARLPRLTRGRALAAVSSLTGSLATIAPLALAGAAVGNALGEAVLAAVGVYLLPAPAQIAGQTVPSGEAVPT